MSLLDEKLDEFFKLAQEIVDLRKQEAGIPITPFKTKTLCKRVCAVTIAAERTC